MNRSYESREDKLTQLTDHALSQWSSSYLESLEGLKDLRVPLRLSTLMREAGFVDVESRMIPLHTCGWSAGEFVLGVSPISTDILISPDPRQNEIGMANRENVQRFLASLAEYPLTEKLG